MRLLGTILLASTLTQNVESVSPDLTSLMARVRERIAKYYTELQSLAWTQKAHREILNKDRTPKEKPRDLVFDSIIHLQPPTPPDTGVPFYIREQSQLRIVDGKPVKKGEKPKDTDPINAGLGSLGIFLATDSRAPGYSYSHAGTGELNDRKVVLVDIVSAQRTPPRVDIDKKFVGFGVRYNLEIFGIQYNKGRLWIDAENYDVLRSEWRSDPFEFEVKGDKYRHEISMTQRFRLMQFENPDRTILVRSPLSGFEL